MSYTIVDADYIRRDADGAFIPNDAANVDRRAYQAWLADGNMPKQPPIPGLPDIKASALAALTERRRRAEASGTSVDGRCLPTDEKMQARLTAAVVASVLDNDYSVRWRLADGSFVLLDHASLIRVAQHVRAHVQGCFDHEAALAAQIHAAVDAAGVAELDLEAGWPG